MPLSEFPDDAGTTGPSSTFLGKRNGSFQRVTDCQGKVSKLVSESRLHEDRVVLTRVPSGSMCAGYTMTEPSVNIMPYTASPWQHPRKLPR